MMTTTNKYKGVSMEYKGFFALVFLMAMSYWLISTPVAHAASLQKAPNNLGLVGYWSFNDGRGTVATDFSGNRNPGTLANGPSWVAGKLGYGLSFDGTNDYVQIASISAPTSLTVTGWIKRTGGFGALNQERIIMCDVLLSNGFGVYFHSNDALEFGTPGSGAVARSTTTISDTNWHHFVLSWNGTTATWYIDGASAGSSAYAPTFATDTYSIGRASYGGFLHAVLDELRVYRNRALGAGEVTALYNAGAARLKAPNSDGLVAYWSMNNCSGLRATDYSGQGNDGTLTGGPTWGTGRAGCALNFDGSDDYVTVPAITGLTAINSVSLWVKLNSLSAGMNQYLIDEGDNNHQIQIYDGDNSNGLPKVAFDGQLGAGATELTSAGTWYHVVAIANGTTVSVYLNGVLDWSTARVSATPSNIKIGRQGSAGFHLNGSLDDVRMYNRVLSAAEITSLYTLGVAGNDAGRTQVNSSQKNQLISGLVGYWTFNGGDTPWSSATAGTTRDVSGNGNTGALTNMLRSTSPVAGISGQGLLFDGVDDKITATPIKIPSGDMTLSTWVKLSSITGNQDIISDGDGGFVELRATRSGDGKFSFGTNGEVGLESSAYTAGTWHHIVAITSGSTKTLYVDGAQVATGAAVIHTQSAAGVNIGSLSGTSRFLNGSLDEARIYNRALSAAEVKQLYFLGRASTR